MADIHEPAVRSYNMSRIKSKNTMPELIVRKYLHSHGLRYRLYDKNLPGKPDIVLKKFKTVVYVHGCFWHMHEGCKYFVIPKTRTNWWLAKLENNRKRDTQNQNELKKMGWKIIIIWECKLKTDSIKATLKKLSQQINI